MKILTPIWMVSENILKIKIKLNGLDFIAGEELYIMELLLIKMELLFKKINRKTNFKMISKIQMEMSFMKRIKGSLMALAIWKRKNNTKKKK